ncbi:MAG: hypothetical protein NTZ31_02675 [Actinobacteria bacterium]|nr:hypothetical protein [Actinomycetota bacterium]
MLKKILLLTAVVALIGTSMASAASVKSPNGAILTVSKTSSVNTGDKLTITGSHFDETVGIYLALCKIVKKIELPTPCGGGIDKTGATGSSIWISSNPPPYGVGLAKEYLPGGRFSYTIRVSPMIGKLDCRKIACAIYVRADHTRSDDRSFDIAVPITFKK